MSENPYSVPNSLPEASAEHKPKGFSWLECLVVFVIIGLIVMLFLPASRRGVRPAALRMSCANNLKQISLALLNYESAYGRFPPAFTTDSTGQKLHSWRTLILPYIEQQALYDSIDLAKPWNDRANEAARDQMPYVYDCPSLRMEPGYTNYLGVSGPSAFFGPRGSRVLSEFTDGTDQTLMVVESNLNSAVHWMSPQDISLDEILSFTRQDGDEELPHPGGRNATFVDGSTQYLPGSLAESELRALVSIDGNDSSSILDQ